MRTKTQRLKTIRGFLRNLRARQVDARMELRVLESAINFYEQMEVAVNREPTRYALRKKE